MSVEDIIDEAYDVWHERLSNCDCYDYKDVAAVQSEAIADVAFRHGAMDLVRDMPDGSCCPRAFAEWLDRHSPQ